MDEQGKIFWHGAFEEYGWIDEILEQERDRLLEQERTEIAKMLLMRGDSVEEVAGIIKMPLEDIKGLI